MVFMVCIASTEPLETLRPKIEEVLKIKFEPGETNKLGINSEYHPYVYADSDGKRWCAILIPAARYLNDRDMNFEDYNHFIVVGAFNVEKTAERTEIAAKFARLIFDTLKATSRYELMLVEGVQKKIDQFLPPKR